MREIRHDAKTLLALLEGGDGVTYERSIRGRLHHMDKTLAALALRRRYGLGQAKAWQSALLILCAVGVWLSWQGLAIGFIAFRVFDQLKPWPANVAEKRLPRGWGVMFDDVFAGVWGALLLIGLRAANVI